jgi:hypothetical protein
MRCMRQLAKSDTKIVLISAPSSLPQKSQLRLPTTCRRRFISSATTLLSPWTGRAPTEIDCSVTKVVPQVFWPRMP